MIESKVQVAIKEIDLNKLPKKELEQLVQEKSLLQMLKHPNIIELMNVFEIPAYNFMIFEFCKGGDLFDRISTEGNFYFIYYFLIILLFFINFIFLILKNRWIYRVKSKKNYENFN